MTDDAGTAGNEATGLTRRQLIQRGVVAGGIIWTAPLIESVVSSAGAVSSPGHITIPDCHNSCASGVNCSATFVVFQKAGDSTFYVVKIDQCGNTCSTDTKCGVPGGGTFPARTCGGHNFFAGTAPMNEIFVDSILNPPATCDVANCASDIIISGNTITAGPGITFVFVAVHDGSFGAPQWISFCP
jgi:hypothetical protein